MTFTSRQFIVRSVLCFGLLITSHGLTEPSLPKAKSTVDFTRDVLPILSSKCFNCHGADADAREADLRLDVREEAIKAKAIAPGDLSRSELWARMLTTDPDEVMPPPETKKTLTEKEKDILKRWIEEGATYSAHWAFVPPSKPAVPEVAGVEAPIDRFIQARLAAEGLNPAPPAGKTAWLRRITFDLTGLAPTLAEIDAFEADTAPDAKRKVVDRLLNTSTYGECMAVDWLDVARYADTYGRHEDADCITWPYRDWVIKAFNANMPYDQFITEQTAGDLLPGATEDQIVATAFNRLAKQSNEAGSDPEEFRMEQVADRVKTNGIAFLGLSIECARCHDHKYDPISTKDYYSLAAYLNNIDELGLFGVYVGASPPPTIQLYNPAQKAARQQLLQRIADLEKELAANRESAKSRFTQWLTQNQPPHYKERGLMEKVGAWFVSPLPKARPRKPFAHYAFDSILKKVLVNEMDRKTDGLLRNNMELQPGKLGSALDMEGDNRARLPGIPEIRRSMPFTLSAWVQPGEHLSRAVIMHRSRAGIDAGCRGVEVVVDDGKVSFALVHYTPGHEIRVRVKQALPIKQWTHLAFTYDGSSKASGLKIFWNGQLTETDTIRDHLTRDIVYRSDWNDDTNKDKGEELAFGIGHRMNDAGMRNMLIDELVFHDAVLSQPEIAHLALLDDHTTPDAWFDWYLREVDEPNKSLLAQLQAAREEENVLSGQAVDFMVMKEYGGPRRPTHILKRGQFDQPDQLVEPEVPSQLFAPNKDAPKNRLGLAQWLVDPKNPLTSRVAVNRLWQHFFGRGIVATAEDFGTQGSPPSHPELLDYLATHFIEIGWEMKALVREIVLSQTYGQEATLPPANDPEHTLLSGFPRLRLKAEELRDHVLASAGILERKIGGPSVKPYQPAGLWEEAGTQHSYVTSKGTDLFRRSLYTFWRRTLPPPTMTLFDAPTREYCKPRRDHSSTPLQSLVLMNDPQIIEAARLMAQHLIQRYPQDIPQRAAHGWRALTTHAPTAEQLTLLTTYHAEELTASRAQPEQTKTFLTTVGTLKPDPKLPQDDLAATTHMIRLIMSYADTIEK